MEKLMKRLRPFEIAAWVAGLGLLGAYVGARYWYAYSYESALASFHAARSTSQITQSERHQPSIDTSTWSRHRIERYQESTRNSLAPEALLHIPSLQLIVPVFDGTSETNLNRGAGRIEGTARIGEHGNLGIAAHRDGFFRALKDVRVGDALLIERLATTDAYRIAAIHIVGPSDVSVLNPTQTRSVTLVTCYPFYHVGAAPQRFIVRAEIVADDRGRDTPSALAEMIY
jgi:sortase A